LSKRAANITPVTALIAPEKSSQRKTQQRRAKGARAVELSAERARINWQEALRKSNQENTK